MRMLISILAGNGASLTLTALRVLGLLACFLVLLWCYPAGAEQPVAEVILMATQGQHTLVEQVLTAAEGQISDLPVAIRVHWLDAEDLELAEVSEKAKHVATKRGALLTFWFVALESTELYLYIAEPRAERIQVRKVGAVTQGGAEQAALHLRTVISVSLASTKRAAEVHIVSPNQSRDIALEEHSIPPPQPMRPTQESGHSTGIELSALGGSIGYAAFGGPIVHALEMELLVAFGDQWEASLGYGLRTLHRAQNEVVAVSVQSHPVHAGVHYFRRAGSWRLGAGMRGSVNYTTLGFTPQRNETIILGRSHNILYSLSPSLIADRPLGRGFSLRFTAGLQLPLNAVRYATRVGTQEQILLESWIVRPRILLGLVWQMPTRTHRGIDSRKIGP